MSSAHKTKTVQVKVEQVHEWRPFEAMENGHLTMLLKQQERVDDSL